MWTTQCCFGWGFLFVFVLFCFACFKLHLKVIILQLSSCKLCFSSLAKKCIDMWHSSLPIFLCSEVSAWTLSNIFMILLGMDSKVISSFQHHHRASVGILAWVFCKGARVSSSYTCRHCTGGVEVVCASSVLLHVANWLSKCLNQLALRLAVLSCLLCPYPLQCLDGPTLF